MPKHVSFTLTLVMTMIIYNSLFLSLVLVVYANSLFHDIVYKILTVLRKQNIFITI
ncbi:hypothetical protein HanPSC8_Chr17g0773971 [Helianthus annuus]|nr:hypothetical protein HanPSC8_Chr17g0773971 [Helianthus annuus]